MALLKRAANDPAVLREASAKRRRIAVANSVAADPAAADPDSTIANLDSAAADPALCAAKQSPVNSVLRRPSTPVSAEIDADSNYTEFHAPALSI